MEIDDISTVGVVGAGAMGTGIAQVFARQGFVVFLFDETLKIAEKGKERIEKNITLSKNKKPCDGITLEFIIPKEQNALNFKKLDFVIEAVIENLEVKQQIFMKLNKYCPKETIFATNTSSIQIQKIAESLSSERKKRFIGMHFMNPPTVIKLLEIIKGKHTTNATEATVINLALDLKRNPILSSMDTSGFIVNRGLMLNIREALIMIEDGTGSLKDINIATLVGVGGSMGPLDIGDLIGWDIVLNILETCSVLGERFMPPKILKDIVNAKFLGKKTKKGIYDFINTIQ